MKRISINFNFYIASILAVKNKVIIINNENAIILLDFLFRFVPNKKRSILTIYPSAIFK